MPVDSCVESKTKPGVFGRKRTKADASIDCNGFAAEIKMFDQDARSIQT
jgi:hypothetical protein